MRDEFDGYSNKELELAIDEWIRGKEDREMAKLKLIDHVPVERIAEMFCLSPMTVYRRLKKTKETILSMHDKKAM